MSGHAQAASPEIEPEIHIDCDDERTLPHDPESHSESDDKRMSQQRPLLQSSKGREPQRWISETEWIDYVHPRRSSDVSIFRVPKFLKDTKREVYVPRTVSLGPYHHGSAELPSMGHHKGGTLRRMMKRFNVYNNIVPVDPNDMDFANRAMEEILKLEKKIRDIYEENIDCSGETLARMLVLDGCFLLEALRTLGVNELAGEMASERYSPLNREIKFGFDVKDILMLENQIPFIVLAKLLQLELNTVVDVDTMRLYLLKTTWRLFTHFDDRIFDISGWLDTQNIASVPHLPHLLGFLHTVLVSPTTFFRRDRLGGSERSICIKECCRQCIKGRCSPCIECCCSPWFNLQDRIKKTRNDVQRIRPAVELRKAGITFKPSEGGILDIRFDDNSATIFLPPIRVTDMTEVLFHNLIAFEMCRPLEPNYVGYYVNFMDNLIDSEEDVALLIRMGVLGNWLGRNKEVVDLFKGLRKATVVNLSDVFGQLIKRVNDHYENQIRVEELLQELILDYFSSPWKALASAAAIVLLLLTLVQTIFTIISVYR